jgi:hypothetical protein
MSTPKTPPRKRTVRLSTVIEWTEWNRTDEQITRNARKIADAIASRHPRQTLSAVLAVDNGPENPLT